MSQGIFRRRRLPHWDVEDATYFVTACLEGSIPALGLARLKKLRADLDRRPRPPDLSIEQWEVHKHKLLFAELDKTIDCEPAVRYLADPLLANQVQDSLLHFAGTRYDLLAFAVMPSHYHWLFHPRAEWVETQLGTKQEATCSRWRTPRQLIVKSVNGFTARECNRLLNRTGQFWQDECYDHVVRDDDELLRTIAYIENDPVKAGLVARPEDWHWSSACLRKELKISHSEPLDPARGADIPVCQSGAPSNQA
jgi:REP-associated tyrosine transposase